MLFQEDKLAGSGFPRKNSGDRHRVLSLKKAELLLQMFKNSESNGGLRYSSH